MNNITAHRLKTVHSMTSGNEINIQSQLLLLPPEHAWTELVDQLLVVRHQLLWVGLFICLGVQVKLAVCVVSVWRGGGIGMCSECMEGRGG